jgi:hypothetical protein
VIAALASVLLLAADPNAVEPTPAPVETTTPRPALSPEDAAVVEHLELLEKLDLLQDLEVVDTGRDEDPREGGPRKK